FDPLRARDRAVMRLNEHFARELVQRRRESLRQTARVYEQEGRAVRADQFQKPWMDRRPDRCSWFGLRWSARQAFGLADFCHLLDRNFDAQRQLLFLAGVDDR